SPRPPRRGERERAWRIAGGPGRVARNPLFFVMGRPRRRTTGRQPHIRGARAAGLSPSWRTAMPSELLQALGEQAPLVIAGLAALFAVGVVQWRKFRETQAELAFKLEALERGLSVEQVERLVALRSPHRKSWLEQFAALSGGAKAGLIIGVVLIANM